MMPAPPDRAYHEEMQGRVRGVLIALESKMSSEEAHSVGDLIDNNEYGIALEWLVDTLVEEGIAVEAPLLDDIQALLNRMKLPSDTLGQLRILSRIAVGRWGLIGSGSGAGMWVKVQDDRENTGGFLVLLATNPDHQDGGDYWVETIDALDEFFGESGWQVEWSDHPGARRIVEIPEELRPAVAALPEIHMGVTRVSVELRDGRVVPNVDVGWADEIVAVGGSTSFDFESSEIIAVFPSVEP